MFGAPYESSEPAPDKPRCLHCDSSPAPNDGVLCASCLWVIQEEAKRGFGALAGYLERQAAFEAYCAARDSTARELPTQGEG